MAVHAILLCPSKATELEFNQRNIYPTPIRYREFRDLGSVCMKFDRSINVNSRESFSPTQVSKVKHKHPTNCFLETFEEKLEDIRFKHLYPEEFEKLSTKVFGLYDKNVIKHAIRKLEGALKERNMPYHAIYGREKSLYSIHKKMSRKKLRIDEIYDIYGLRIILETKGDCFLALNIVAQVWPRVVKIKDYISNPKPNRYQSLHVVVMCEQNVPIEIQIRSREMHLQAEYGIAAHWKYKQQQIGDPCQN